MANTSYNSTQEMIDKLQLLKGKTKLNFHQNISNYYDDMNIRRQNGIFQFEEDPFSKVAQGIGKNYHEVLLLMKFLRTKPQVKNLNNKYYDIYYTVFKNTADKENVDDK